MQNLSTSLNDKTSTLNLITDEEAASLLGQKPRTLAAWRSTGRYNLPFVKIGRQVFYREKDLEDFVNQRTFYGHGKAPIGEAKL